MAVISKNSLVQPANLYNFSIVSTPVSNPHEHTTIYSTSVHPVLFNPSNGTTNVPSKSGKSRCRILTLTLVATTLILVATATIVGTVVGENVKKTTSTINTETSSTATTSNHIVVFNLLPANLSRLSVIHNTWQLYNYTYAASTNTTVVINFTTGVDKHNDWLIDDVSIRDLSGSELSTNGDFESSPPFVGWNPSSPSAGICTVAWNSSVPCHVGSCYVHDCRSATGSPDSWASLTQPLNVFYGQVYHVSFWARLETYSGSGHPWLFLNVS